MKPVLLPLCALLSALQIALAAPVSSNVYSLREGYVDANGVLIYLDRERSGFPE